MARQLLVPVGLASLTTAQRDALSASDGQLVWNADLREVEQYRQGRWRRVDDAALQLIGELTESVGRLRTALRSLGLEPDLFESDT